MENSKYPTLAERRTLHKFVVVCQLMMETLDEMDLEVVEFKAALDKAEVFLNGIFDEGENPLPTTMYLDNLVKKVDTIIRKNYKDQV